MTSDVPTAPPPYWACVACQTTGARAIGDVPATEVAYLAENHDRAYHDGQRTAVVVDPESGRPIALTPEALTLFPLSAAVVA